MKKRVLKEALYILAGSFLMALCTKCIFDPAGMVMGGFNGIAIVLRHLTETVINGGVPLWLTTTVLNIPLFIAAWRILGFAFIKKTLITTALVSVWLFLIPENIFVIEDDFLVCVFGAIISGLSIGLVFSVNSSTGGTDTLAAILKYFKRDISAVKFLQLIDGVIVIGSGFVFGLEKTLYALVAIYIVTKVSELVLEGSNFAKQIFIISEHLEEISQRIMEEVDRGVTYVQSKGAYTGKERKMAFCIVSKRQITAIKDIVEETDPNAFMVLADVREVMGEGFKSES